MQPARYLPRLITPALLRALKVFPVAVVTGARQTGKSTLVRRPEIQGRRTYLTLDDLMIRDEARGDPDLLLDRAGGLVLDEVQRAPDLLLALKRRVDQGRRRGQYILTGSSDLLLQRDVSESLAGRAGYLTLGPLTRREQLGQGQAGIWSDLVSQPPRRWLDLLSSQTAPAESWRTLARRGGYPVPAHDLSKQDERSEWLAAYAATYLERDLRQLAAIEQLADMRRLMAALCLRLGGILSQAQVARDLSLPSSTVQRYLNLLEVSYQLVRLPAYSVNRTRRLVKAPKIYWSDTGLALHLAGERELRAAHLENLVLTDLLAWAGAAVERPTLLHWRTHTGAEVDFVVELPGRLLPIEVKAARRVSRRDARHLRSFLDDYSKAPAGLLLYDGEETIRLDRDIVAAPWHRVI